MSKGYQTIKLKKKQHIAWIILDRPDKLNAINNVMMKEISETIDALEEDTDVRCILIAGEGKRAFSAGADLTDLRKLTPQTAAQFSVKGQQVLSKLEEQSKPVVAVINGYALGGGLELALACDFRIAAEGAEFGCPEIKLGFIPGWGGTQRLPLLVGLSNAKRMIMTGDKIKANKALKIGLINRVVPLNELENEAEAFAQKICELPPEAQKQAKQIINSITKASFNSGLKKETEAFTLLCSSKETKERLGAFGSQRNKK